ncbi:type II TA system antitoxin MqsA family protein [Candidatus Neptunochlamydia vexilliferae]|uniref:type II TA system antitoxin MqsA family protein n=1 Tax=Candidatus Neptunichlamydia vexilliferae TaxID=1651774 RepID=UPI00189131A2|nr:type II TA system antitoxin MqsA family protein [Candidatus Neptunochlamydia vexilliferae]
MKKEIMKCLECNKTQFVEQKIRFTPEIKGETVEVIVPCMVCKSCQSPLMNTEQMNVLRRASADKYRENHSLLTSSQIIAYREKLGMSQSAFARYLGTGEASIKRWETYYIQDMSQDELIRLKCDEAAAEMNFLNVHWKRDEPTVYSGNVKFNLQLFKNVALYLVEHTKESILFLNKLHFYVDFYHFKKYGVSLTGARYTPLKLGPCPDQYSPIYEALVRGGYLKKVNNHAYKALVPSDPALFEDREKETLEFILNLYKSLGAQKVLKTSHEEEGYIKTEEGAFISYESAKNLHILKKMQ